MMRHTSFLLHVLFVSTLCLSILGMPLDKRGKTAAASVGGEEMIVQFLNADGSVCTGGQKIPGRIKVEHGIEDVLKELLGTDKVKFTNEWVRPTEVKEDIAFAMVHGGACGKGCFAWFSFPGIHSVSPGYGELRNADSSDTTFDKFKLVAETTTKGDPRRTMEYFTSSQKIAVEYFKPGIKRPKLNGQGSLFASDTPSPLGSLFGSAPGSPHQQT